jgi:hypothetical protein
MKEKHFIGIAVCVLTGSSSVRSVRDSGPTSERILEPQLLDRMSHERDRRVGDKPAHVRSNRPRETGRRQYADRGK